jgi:hypothetical protein
MVARVSVPFTEGHYYGGEERPNTELANNSLCLQEGLQISGQILISSLLPLRAIKLQFRQKKTEQKSLKN